MRDTINNRVEAYLMARAGAWIDGLEIAGIGGGYGWRTRLSNLRKRGHVIENRQRTVREHAHHCPAVQAWDIPQACNCDMPRLFTVSEYRFVPKAEAA